MMMIDGRILTLPAANLSAREKTFFCQWGSTGTLMRCSGNTANMLQADRCNHL